MLLRLGRLTGRAFVASILGRFTVDTGTTLAARDGRTLARR
ncbi:hypothetical protein FBZ83_11613 [Azospirillum brasilense]|uniref:Uncharacterized protein n=1 Tax=Azospirillum brasilense TaxID=192 RepID=A0A560BWN1_AZOBR|nr:hypothetical protein [Azospirillum brasilense]TWA77021.1 hypothetical protein FBZ83_11613 [Azospirillum brasilense]